MYTIMHYTTVLICAVFLVAAVPGCALTPRALLPSSGDYESVTRDEAGQETHTLVQVVRDGDQAAIVFTQTDRWATPNRRYEAELLLASGASLFVSGPSGPSEELRLGPVGAASLWKIADAEGDCGLYGQILRRAAASVAVEVFKACGERRVDVKFVGEFVVGGVWRKYMNGQLRYEFRPRTR